jgi:hypothetical protein
MEYGKAASVDTAFFAFPTLAAVAAVPRNSRQALAPKNAALQLKSS